MKKTLIAVAALSAMAASAMAANVTVYGVIDTGFNYQYKKVGDKKGVNSFTMATGQNSGSRLGFKGVEELGNGMKVGFILENGFKSDTGADDDASLAFRREANLYVMTDFGTLSMARVGSLTSTAGSYNLAKYAPFGGGWGDATAKQADFMLADRARMDNTVTYVSPSFAGVKAYAQYSFQQTNKETAGNERQNDRYAGIGLTYDQGAFSTALVVDSVLNKSAAKNKKDSLGVTWGASYDFGVAKLFAQAQYGEHENKFGGIAVTSGTVTGWDAVTEEGVKGYGVSLGTTAPVAGGTVYAQVNYLDAKTDGKLAGADYDKIKTKNWGVAAAYAYPLSKRTSVYTFASYSQLKQTTEAATDTETKTKKTEVGVGLVHKF